MARIEKRSDSSRHFLREFRLVSCAPGSLTHEQALDIALTKGVPACAPGTVAQAYGAVDAFHAQDHFFVSTFQVPTPDFASKQVLKFESLASLCAVFLNGEKILESDNMFVSHSVDVTGRIHAAGNTLVLLFHSLSRALAQKKPRPAWKPALVDSQNLRFFRQTLIGHLPGWCPEISAVGPAGFICLEDQNTHSFLESIVLHARARDLVPHVTVTGRFSGDDLPAEATLKLGKALVKLPLHGDGSFSVAKTLSELQLWWPHTHGEPTTYRPILEWSGHRLELQNVGFREIEIDKSRSGFTLTLNQTPIFARGAVWTPNATTLRHSSYPVHSLIGAGFNMLRVTGTFHYESGDFFDMCTQAGILVWHDLMFANFDYPSHDATFMGSVAHEVRQFIEMSLDDASLAVICGGSEVFQQASMMGVSRAKVENAMFTQVFPQWVSELHASAAYVSNSPSTGTVPFVSNEGVAHYYGVGAYKKPLEDARRANVSFASECLGFSNVADETHFKKNFAAQERFFHHPKYKEGVPRDRYASYDFDEVTAHYTKMLFGENSLTARSENSALGFRFARQATREVAERTMLEFRHSDSKTAGALVWFYRDLRPGSGFGIVDSDGHPKSTYYGLKAACQPVSIALTDEGVNGLEMTLINEKPSAFHGKIEFQTFTNDIVSARAKEDVTLPGHSRVGRNANSFFEHFIDLSYAFKFGAPSHIATRAALFDAHDGLVSESWFFIENAFARLAPTQLKVRVVKRSLFILSTRVAMGVCIDDSNFVASDNYFHLFPGQEKEVHLHPRVERDESAEPSGEIACLNVEHAVSY